MADLNRGLTQEIIDYSQKQGLLRNECAYVLATAYWETGRTMQPVVEAFWLDEDWREKNLRYYPWHGRGLVQLTWESNYRKAGLKLNTDLTTDPNTVMEPDISVKILVKGCAEGWFTGKKLSDYMTLKKSNYVGARRIVNGTDKAHAIAELARDYEAVLIRIGYGVEDKTPVVNDRRNGKSPRSNPMQSTTNIAAAGGVVTTVANASDEAKGIVGTFTEAFGVSPQLALAFFTLAGLGWVFRERLRKWAEGDR